MTKLQLLISQANSLGNTGREAIFRSVVVALTENAPFDVSQIYELPYDDFELVIEALREWRLQRYVYGAAHAGHLRPATENSPALPA